MKCQRKSCDKPAIISISWLPNDNPGTLRQHTSCCADHMRELWNGLKAFPTAAETVILSRIPIEPDENPEPTEPIEQQTT